MSMNIPINRKDEIKYISHRNRCTHETSYHQTRLITVGSCTLIRVSQVDIVTWKEG
jgi:hypothetical protein